MIELIQRKIKKKLSRNIMHLFTLIFLGKTNVNFRSEGCAQGSCEEISIILGIIVL